MLSAIEDVIDATVLSLEASSLLKHQGFHLCGLALRVTSAAIGDRFDRKYLI